MLYFAGLEYFVNPVCGIWWFRIPSSGGWNCSPCLQGNAKHAVLQRFARNGGIEEGSVVHGFLFKNLSIKLCSFLGKWGNPETPTLLWVFYSSAQSSCIWVLCYNPGVSRMCYPSWKYQRLLENYNPHFCHHWLHYTSISIVCQSDFFGEILFELK